ncbi:MAG: DUF971 domain-containing protein [Deltaproteobacteria bacterium]|nr:DUF971 domain-containing protein [Deltaproteobacteria bacterium]
MANSDAHRPTQIQQHDDRTLAVDWADGAKSLLDVRALEWSGAPLLAPDSVPEDVMPRAIQSVGRYAIQIEWSDGHSTGIYAFERLRSLADQGLLSRSEQS